MIASEGASTLSKNSALDIKNGNAYPDSQKAQKRDSNPKSKITLPKSYLNTKKGSPTSQKQTKDTQNIQFKNQDLLLGDYFTARQDFEKGE